jgi:hypothetical protein
LLLLRDVIPAPCLPVIRAFVFVTVATFAAACSDDGSVSTPTSATTTTTTTTAEASISEEFTGTLAVGASAFYSFSVTQYGTVNITFSAIGGASVPGTAWMGIGVGTPSGTDCSTTTTVNVQAGTGPHITGVYDVGVYCAKIWDLGNQYGPANFTVVIAHP